MEKAMWTMYYPQVFCFPGTVYISLTQTYNKFVKVATTCLFSSWIWPSNNTYYIFKWPFSHYYIYLAKHFYPKWLYILFKVYISSVHTLGIETLTLMLLAPCCLSYRNITLLTIHQNHCLSHLSKQSFVVHLSGFSKNLLDGSSPRKTTLRRQKGEMLRFSRLSFSGYIKDKAKSRLYNKRLVGVKWR